MNKKVIVIAICMSLGLTACLQTRANLRGSQGSTTPVTVQQQKAAEDVLKKEDNDKEFRELYGRIETVEKQVSEGKDSEKIKSLETRLAQMETDMGLLRATVSELNAKSKKEAQMMSSDERAEKGAKSAPVSKSALSDAAKHFNEKKWDDAILAYEDYRKKNPKGAEYAEATLKMGLCFQNMGLKDDAKVFFKEVVEKYPKSKEADTAKSKLKKL